MLLVNKASLSAFSLTLVQMSYYGELPTKKNLHYEIHKPPSPHHSCHLFYSLFIHLFIHSTNIKLTSTENPKIHNRLWPLSLQKFHSGNRDQEKLMNVISKVGNFWTKQKGTLKTNDMGIMVALVSISSQMATHGQILCTSLPVLHILSFSSLATLLHLPFPIAWNYSKYFKYVLFNISSMFCLIIHYVLSLSFFPNCLVAFKWV